MKIRNEVILEVATSLLKVAQLQNIDNSSYASFHSMEDDEDYIELQSQLLAKGLKVDSDAFSNFYTDTYYLERVIPYEGQPNYTYTVNVKVLELYFRG